MPSTPTTKSQVQAYRFVLRRMESALVRKDPVMLHDPMRSHKRSTVVGAIVGVVGLVGFLLFAVLKPAPTVPDSGIVIAQPSGSVYVVSQNPHELLPVFNVVSGRLLLAATQQQQNSSSDQGSQPAAPDLVKPVTVTDTQLQGVNIPIGQMEGIPDGPTSLPNPGQAPTTWAVCDYVAPDNNAPDPTGHKAPQTSVLVGVSDIGQNLRPDQALLVSSDNGRTLNLVYGLTGNANFRNASAVRAVVQNNPAVDQALGVSRTDYRVISPAVLNAIPSVTMIQDPTNNLNLAQQPMARLANAGLSMGEAFQVQPVTGSVRYYLVVPGGIEQVTNTTAQIARFAHSHGQSDIRHIQPDTTDGVPVVPYGDPGGLRVNVTSYPNGPVVPTIIKTNSKPAMCLGWQADFSDPSQPLAKTRVTVDFNLDIPKDPNTGQPMSMVGVQQSSPTGAINSFFMNPNLGGVAVRAATNAGEFTSGQIYVIDPRGVRFSVPDLFTAQVIGVASGTQAIPPAPQSIVTLLQPGGSQLDTQAVQRAFGGMQVPPTVGRFLPGPATQANSGGGG